METICSSGLNPSQGTQRFAVEASSRNWAWGQASLGAEVPVSEGLALGWPQSASSARLSTASWAWDTPPVPMLQCPGIALLCRAYWEGLLCSF